MKKKIMFLFAFLLLCSVVFAGVEKNSKHQQKIDPPIPITTLKPVDITTSSVGI